MDEAGVFVAKFVSELADGFEVGETFDIAGGAADFDHHNVAATLFSGFGDFLLDRVGDVRDNLDCFAEKLAFAFFFEYFVVNFSSGDGG